MSDVKGQIPLHDRHSIVLYDDIGRIGLHSFGETGWKVGIKLNVDLRHYRKAGMTTGFMTLDKLELVIPGAKGVYTGHIKDWDLLNTQGYISYFKPHESKLLPLTDDYVTFHLLDAFQENDPYFYFGWGLRSDMMPPYGYRSRAAVAYLGVNYVIPSGFPPVWTDVPSQEVLFKMLRPSAPDGVWHLKANVSGFIVDAEVTQQTHLLFHVWEGRSRFFRGMLDYVKDGARVVGQQNVNWTSSNWGNLTTPGDLSILSGAANGYHFRVIGKEWTGDAPPPGYPANTWLIVTHPEDPVPSWVGVAADDEFELTGPFEDQSFDLINWYRVCGPGSYMPLDLDLVFLPVL
jgi:hypothetical protein